MLENDNTVLIKGLKKVVNVKFSRNTHLIETSYDRLEIKRIIFSNIGTLQSSEFSDVLQISMNIKDITIPLIIHYYLLRAFKHYTNSFHANHNVRFLQPKNSGRWHNVTCVRANPLCDCFTHSRTLPAEKFPVRAVDIVNLGIQ